MVPHACMHVVSCVYSLISIYICIINLKESPQSPLYDGLRGEVGVEGAGEAGVEVDRGGRGAVYPVLAVVVKCCAFLRVIIMHATLWGLEK